MKRSIVFATSHMAAVRTAAPAAERAGFHGAWLTEYTDRDALIRSTLAGGVTSELAIGTGISYSFTRHPLALAAAALDVQEATGGRFRLGLGTGTAGMRGKWYGLPTDGPVRRLVETVELLRSAWKSEGGFKFVGEHVAADVPGLALRARSDQWGTPPIYGSGIGPGMVAAAARCCDGALLHPLAVGTDYESRFLIPALARGISERVVSEPFAQIQWVITAVDDDVDAAYQLAQRAVAFYLATASYATYFADTRWESVQQAVEAAFKSDGADWAALARLVPAELVDDFCIVGTPTTARERADQLEQRLASRGVSEVVLQVAATGTSIGDTQDVFEQVINTFGTKA